MKIIHSPPPNWETIEKKFGIPFKAGVIVTYYPNVYCVVEIPPDLEVHEAVHLSQQKAYGVEAWWARYLSDKEFRLSQEIEAYRTQYAWAQLHYGRQERRGLLKKCAKDLSGPVYGRIISYDDAEIAILNLI